MKKQSNLSRFFCKLKMDSIAWSLRRLYCPVERGDIVLEVGSGGRPYFRANVLCDADIPVERLNMDLVKDRPMVLGFAENLPFQDDSFDFIIASYVFEHTEEPEKFIAEIQRVARAGFLEFPDALRERFTCVPYHTLEISVKEDVLHIRKKTAQIHDKELNELLNKKTDAIFNKCMVKNPFSFQHRFYWSKDTGKIKYKMLNSEYEFNWKKREVVHGQIEWPGIVAMIKLQLLHLFRKLFSQTRRNREIDIYKYICCVECKGSEFKRKDSKVICKNCCVEYDLLDEEIIDFTRLHRPHV